MPLHMRLTNTTLPAEMEGLFNSKAEYSEIQTSRQVERRLYTGVDLTQEFSGEISSDPWSWIRSRLTAVNYEGLNPGDYIPFTCTDGSKTKLNAEIAGIDTYYRYGDTETKHHIDFICRELWPVLHVYNKVNFNNGISDTVQEPWLASDLHKFVNSLSGSVPNGTAVGGAPLVEVDYTQDGIFYYLPAELKAAINASQEKRALLPRRYSASGVLTEDNGWAWQNMGKLWIPAETEVYGHAVWGSRGWSEGGFQQYPIFSNNMHRLKLRNGTRYHWWVLGSRFGNSTNFCDVGYDGAACYFSAANTYIAAPVCFRLTA